MQPCWWKIRRATPILSVTSRHTLAEAQAHLPELVARAQSGEEVVITLEDGRRVELMALPSIQPALPPVPARNGAELLAWLDKVRVGALRPDAPDAATLVRQMRDSGY